MPEPGAAFLIYGPFAAISLFLSISAFMKKRTRIVSYLSCTWIFFLCFFTAKMFSITPAVWILGAMCFLSLKEYFTLVDLRLQDRLGVLGAYLCIPFMIYLIQDAWYGFFIVSIPVYGFLVISLLVTLGGKVTEGTVFSMGAIDFGLLLFVYCLGHIGYMMHYSISLAGFLICSVALCDLSYHLAKMKARTDLSSLLFRYFAPIPVILAIALLLKESIKITTNHCFIISCLIPILAILGQHTIRYVKADLGVRKQSPETGKGMMLDNLKSLWFVAPVLFHYVWYFLP